MLLRKAWPVSGSSATGRFVSDQLMVASSAASSRRTARKLSIATVCSWPGLPVRGCTGKLTAAAGENGMTAPTGHRRLESTHCRRRRFSHRATGLPGGFNGSMQHTCCLSEGVLQMKYRTRTFYTDSQKALMWERWRQRWTLYQIAQLFNRAHTSVQGILVRSGGLQPPQRTRSALELTLADREEISRRSGRSIDAFDCRASRTSAVDYQPRD